MRNAVGGMKARVTGWSRRRRNTASASKPRPRIATTGTPSCSAGSTALSSPPAQAQSAGVPHQVALGREAAVGIAHARHVAGQHAVAVQRALRLARRPGRVDHQGGGLGQRVEGGEEPRLALRDLAEAQHGTVAPVDRHHGPQRRRGWADRGDLGRTGGVRDGQRHARIGEAMGQRLRAEHRRQRQHDRAEPVDGALRHERVGALGEEQSHAVAGRDAEPPQRQGRAGGPRRRAARRRSRSRGPGR